MTSTSRPCRLQGDRIIIREIEAETLVYDDDTHRAWCLNRSSACIWKLCDGRMTVGTITVAAAAKLGSTLSEELVLLTLEELQEKGLLEGTEVKVLPRDASRRELIGRMGLAAAALLPVVAAITAPPALAQSGSVGTDARRRVRRPAVAPQPISGQQSKS